MSPENDAVVSLREITAENRAAVEALAVTATQSEYVTGVADSLLEAAAEPDARPWFRAVYADDEPVGFVMLSDGITADNPDYLGPYYLWRLLVDHRFQGRGYGSAALRLAIDRLRTRPDADVLLTSVAAGPETPLGFYLDFGFTPRGDVHLGELVLQLPLT